MTLEEARNAFFKASAELYEGLLDIESWRSAWRALEEICRTKHADEKIYPCSSPGCKVMRSKSEGGNIFTVCDKHWDQAVEKPEHAKTCHELIPFKCCACGEECCVKHGLPLERPSKWTVEQTKSVRRCTPCSDSGR